MRRRAYAKINLTLEVLGRRPDGYHDVATVLQAIDLFDEVELWPAPELIFESDIAGVLPEDDIALHAATLLRKKSGVSRGARIRIEKHIPLAAGLGGGSSDAACVLVALNELWDLALPRQHLQALAIDLGSDVPFFLFGGAAYAQGRGETVMPLSRAPSQWFVLICPPIEIDGKTAKLFKMLKPEMFTDGQKSIQVADTLRRGLPCHQNDLVNVFEFVASQAFPGLDEQKDRFLTAGAGVVHLSGAGPTLFALCHDEASARALYQCCQTENLQAFLVKGLPSLV